MSAALLLTAEIAKQLGGKCKQFGIGVLALDGEFHSDCSTCFAKCGDANDMGVAELGFVITQDWRGLSLKWQCPSCGVDTYEQTTLFEATKDAIRINENSFCVRCRQK